MGPRPSLHGAAIPNGAPAVGSDLSLEVVWTRGWNRSRHILILCVYRHLGLLLIFFAQVFSYGFVGLARRASREGGGGGEQNCYFSKNTHKPGISDGFKMLFTNIAVWKAQISRMEKIWSLSYEKIVSKILQNRVFEVPTPKIPSITKGLLGDYCIIRNFT